LARPPAAQFALKQQQQEQQVQQHVQGPAAQGSRGGTNRLVVFVFILFNSLGIVGFLASSQRQKQRTEYNHLSSDATEDCRGFIQRTLDKQIDER